MIAPPPSARTREGAPPPVVEEQEYAERGGPERPLWPWLVAAAFVIAAAVAGFFVWHELSGSKATVPVQLYVGEQQGQAQRQIKAAHLVPDVKHDSSDKYKKGIVASQDPSAGSHLDKGGTVTIVVSTGPPPVDVPDVKGQQWPQAQQNLLKAGLQPVEISVPGKTKGQVSATDPPAGKSVPKGTKVRVNVMSGPATAQVPNVFGLSINAASDKLHAAGFNPNPISVDSDAPQGQVISQNPAPGTPRPKGSTVDLRVSNGPPLTEVPDVVGYTSQQAVQTLESAGFKVAQQPVSTTADQENIVQDQNPAGGSQATKGTTVTIEIGQSAPAPPTTATTTTTTTTTG
jgi:serine/threonine-protein kinase